MARWKKGVSGNPGGRPSGVGEIREIAREHTDEAIQTLLQVMTDLKAPPSARVGAAIAVLDRGWGRPVQSISASIENRPSVSESLEFRALDLLKQVRGEPQITHGPEEDASTPSSAAPGTH